MEILVGRPVRVTDPVVRKIRIEFPNFEGYGVITWVDQTRSAPFTVEFLTESGREELSGNFDGYSIEAIR